MSLRERDVAPPRKPALTSDATLSHTFALVPTHMRIHTISCTFVVSRAISQYSVHIRTIHCIFVASQSRAFSQYPVPCDTILRKFSMNFHTFPCTFILSRAISHCTVHTLSHAFLNHSMHIDVLPCTFHPFHAN